MAKYKILIVDDEEDIVESLSFMLQTQGYETICAYDGEEGLKLAKEENPDLIMLDVMMPKINGYKICRLLKYDAKYKKHTNYNAYSKKSGIRQSNW